MATLADSLVSSSGRRLALRARPDLVATRHRYQGRSYWIVKEPIGLHYFRFQEEEYAILQMLDGHASLDEVKHRFEARFPPQKIRLEELGQFVGMLHRSGLVLSDAAGQGKQLKQRHDERWRQEWLNRLSNILSVRFRGINPEGILNWLQPRMAWIYSRVAVAVCLLMALSALTLVAVQFDEFRAKLPTFHQFFTVSNAFWLMVVLGVTKVIHEFGHGLTCKHFGGECHEMGIMFLVLTPCLYCNVSDSWMLPNKWQRAAIGAAGMYVEMIIASLATFVWWFTQEGLLHNLCLSTMFVCSVSTLVFNGNPLLRYDGYYILSDVLEIPNLSQKASSILSRTLGHLCLGLELQDDPFLPRRNRLLFAVYCVASAIYRWVVVFSILFFLNEFFKPYRLEVIGQAIGMMSLFGLVVHPLWKLGQFFYVPGRIDLVDKQRMWISGGVAAAVLLGICFFPLPHRVYGTLELQAHNAASVYVDVPGELAAVLVKPGQKVTKGTTLARLSNIDLEIKIKELTGRRDQLQSQVMNLERQRFTDPTAGMQVPETRKSLAAVEEQLRDRQRDYERLTLVAPKDGTVLPPPDAPLKPTAERELPSWSGTPFEPRNQGAMLTEGTLFCEIGNPREMEALVVIDQADIEVVRPEETVDIKLDELPGQTLRSQIQEISHESLAVSPRHLSNKAGGELATKTDPTGVERPLSTSYQAKVFPLDDSQGVLRIGLRGRAKIYVRWESLGRRLSRWFSQTFHFRL
ncbi:MAG TPA: site-2 protease family protein [Pirellulales bacterium]|jgi:putative peptide zinc metalloprotease protein|nr:site-2 protease family protein [Pirellulales bacterium]